MNDLLDVSRLQRGKLALQRAPTRLDRICEGAIQSIESEAAAAGVAVGWTIEPDLWVLGDQDRLQQVLMNLLTNAVKFTRGPGRITLRAERAASEGNQPVARISVEDTGIGISPEMIPHLFEIFRQGEIAGTHAAGLGLGLSLVKGIVERHEGRAWAESAGVGKGSRFSIELPLMAPPAQGGPVPGLPEGAAAQAAEPGPPQRRSILLVEDNADTVTVLRESLEARGHEVHTAGSGESALEVLRKFVPDLILADIRLPGMDGYEFLARARQIPAVAGLPAFAVTAYGQEGDVRRAAQAGFMGHFTKPVDLSALDRRIRELPGRAYTRREAA